MSRAAILLGLTLTLSGGVAVRAAERSRPFPRFPNVCARSDFRSGGATVRAELCGAARGASAVVVLHGCGGFSTFDHRLATELPRHGIATLDVDYFGPTRPPSRRGFCGARGAVGAAFPIWAQEVVDAVGHLARLPGPDARSIGLVGWSLGGGVALATAETRLAPIRALALFSVGAFGHAPAPVRPLPPTLLLSGGERDAIPAEETRMLYEQIKSTGGKTQLFVYPNGTHEWPGRQGTAGIARAAAFLRRYLG